MSATDDRGLAAIDLVIEDTARQIGALHNPSKGGYTSASYMAETLRKLVEVRNLYISGVMSSTLRVLNNEEAA